MFMAYKEGASAQDKRITLSIYVYVVKVLEPFTREHIPTTQIALRKYNDKGREDKYVNTIYKMEK